MLNKIGLFTYLGTKLTNARLLTNFTKLEPNQNNAVTASLTNKANTVLGMIQWIGFVVGTAMIIYIGIKYLTAGAGQKAEVKSTMVPLLCGALLVMLAPTIAVWLFSI